MRFTAVPSASLLALLASCTFPSVGITPDGDGGASTTTTSPLASTGDASSATSTSTGQGAADPTTTGSADGGGPNTSGGGDGGRPSTSGGGDGGGGRSTTSGGGDGGTPGTGGDGAGGRTSTSGGGDGGTTATTTTGGDGGGGADTTCGNGCDYTDPTLDCDEDDDDNDTDCQPCNADVFHGQDEYFTTPYTLLGGATSFDYNCTSGDQTDYPFNADGCTAFTAGNCPERAYVGQNPPVCGQPGSSSGCEVTGVVITACSNDGLGTSSAPVPCH